MNGPADETQHSEEDAPSDETTEASASTPPPDRSSDVVIMGGGDAGIAVAERLGEANRDLRIALVEPTTFKYDQPMWVRVGTEGVDEATTRSLEARHVPAGVDWIQDRVASIDPVQRVLRLDAEAPIGYTYLVVATGIGPRWDRIRGLKEGLGTRGICSVYGYEQAARTWDLIRDFGGGTAVFTAPSGPFKGGTTPLSVLHRAEKLWRETGVRDHTELFFATAADPEFAGEAYPDMMTRDREEEDVHVYVGHELIEVRPEHQEAVFSVEKGQSQSGTVLGYDLLHVVPPMRPPAVIEESELAYPQGALRGYLKVDPESLRHTRFATVFGVGDVVGVKGEKTGAQAREQAAEVATTLLRLTEGGV